MTNKKKWTRYITDDFSYKSVAFFISIILWITIMGRRDLVLTKDLKVEFLLPPQYRLVDIPLDRIEVKVSGTRQALQKFSREVEERSITVDLGRYPPGTFKVRVPKERIDLPFGIKLISVKPDKFEAHIEKTGRGDE